MTDIDDKAREIADKWIDMRVCCDKYPKCQTEAWRDGLAKDIAALAVGPSSSPPPRRPPAREGLRR